MIYDLFYFFNEMDLLEIRLNVLDKYVDKFILVEFATNWMGDPKGSNYLDNKDRYNKWEDKIIHYWVDDFPNDQELIQEARVNSNVGAGEHYWIREFYLKETPRRILKSLCQDDDIVFISDLDEIWNPEKINELTDFSQSDVIRPTQKAYYYYLNNRCNEERGWTGTTVCKYKTIKDRWINDLRTRSKTSYIEVQDGGWHFGFMGGIEGAKKKLSDANHTEYKVWEKTIEERVRNNKDYRGRDFKFWTDESDLPQYLKDNKEKWQHLFL